jgi:hypothetical protein
MLRIAASITLLASGCTEEPSPSLSVDVPAEAEVQPNADAGTDVGTFSGPATGAIVAGIAPASAPPIAAQGTGAFAVPATGTAAGRIAPVPAPRTRAPGAGDPVAAAAVTTEPIAIASAPSALPTDHRSVLVRHDGSRSDVEPAGLEDRPWIEVIDNEVEPGWTQMLQVYREVRVHGFPAISANRRTLVWIDGNPDSVARVGVVADARTGRVRYRLAFITEFAHGYPYEAGAERNWERFVRLLEVGRFQTLPRLDAASTTRFTGHGLVVQETEGPRLATTRRPAVEFRDERTGRLLRTHRLETRRLSRRFAQGCGLGLELSGVVTAYLHRVHVAPDRSFVLAWTDHEELACRLLDAHYTFVKLPR